MMYIKLTKRTTIALLELYGERRKKHWELSLSLWCE
jgi:hypothetical protein